MCFLIFSDIKSGVQFAVNCTPLTSAERMTQMDVCKTYIRKSM